MHSRRRGDPLESPSTVTTREGLAINRAMGAALSVSGQSIFTDEVWTAIVSHLKLPRRQEQVLRHVFEGSSDKEIAAELDKTTTAVAGLLKRGVATTATTFTGKMKRRHRVNVSGVSLVTSSAETDVNLFPFQMKKSWRSVTLSQSKSSRLAVARHDSKKTFPKRPSRCSVLRRISF